MLIATAGHVDHGKTMLVRALTGVDTDRLPEEKARGLSIDLGFAYRDLGGGRTLGFVDVPGHERFIRNMLAGVAAIDFGLLVVAADDGVMPQTREHLDILQLLGLERGAVALTKIDRVDAGRRAAVRAAVRDLLDPTALAGAPVLPVCALTGEGIDALSGHLETSAAALDARARGGSFRLAIDRAFSVSGAGVVVTGTAFSGRVAVEDRLLVQPRGTAVRVRGIQAGHREAAEGRSGQRLALNLSGAGLDRDTLHRGHWIVAEALGLATRRIDVRLRLLESEERPLRHWTRVHLHLGSGFASARVALLEARELPPGRSGFAQLHLERATHAVAGDRCIIRDQSARRTLGGGRVVDPFPPARGRARPARLRALRALDTADPARALESLLECSPDGLDLTEFAAARNLEPARASALFEAGAVVEVRVRRRRLGLSARRWEGLCTALSRALAKWHRDHPDQVGPDEGTLYRESAEPASQRLASPALRALIREGRIVRDGQSLRQPDHVPVLRGEDARLWRAVASELGPRTVKPPVVSELSARLRVTKPALLAFLKRSVGRRQLIRVADNRYFHPGALARLARVAAELAENDPQGSFDAATFRDRSGIGRNLTIQVLEHFDAAGLTRRLGDRRIVVDSPFAIFGGAGE